MSSAPNSEVELLQKLLMRIEVLERKVDDLQCKPHRASAEQLPTRSSFYQQSNNQRQMPERYNSSPSPPRHARQSNRYRSPSPRDYYHRYGSPRSRDSHPRQNQARNPSPRYESRRYASPSPHRHSYHRERPASQPYSRAQEDQEHTRHQTQPPQHQTPRDSPPVSAYRQVHFQDESPENCY